MLVLGPPRSGKTSGLVVPTVLGAPGAVVSTSTKPDVLKITAGARGRNGPCLLYDPSGTVETPAGVERVRWSPVSGCRSWDDALLVARGLVGSTRLSGGRGTERVGTDHWSERAQALLAPVLHAAALEGAELKTALSWIDRRQAGPALGILDREGAGIAGDLLAGICCHRRTGAERDLVDGLGGAGRLPERGGPGQHGGPRLRRPGLLRFVGHSVYMCDRAAPGVGRPARGRPAHRHQGRRLRPGRRRESRGGRRWCWPSTRWPTSPRCPISRPWSVREAARGWSRLACLQDLSQARSRWGPAADGFLSLFGTTVVLPGIGDVKTLESLATLAGEEEVATRSLNRPVLAGGGMGRAVVERVLGGGVGGGRTRCPRSPRRPSCGNGSRPTWSAGANRGWR